MRHQTKLSTPHPLSCFAAPTSPSRHLVRTKPDQRTPHPPLSFISVLSSVESRPVFDERPWPGSTTSKAGKYASQRLHRTTMWWSRRMVERKGRTLEGRRLPAGKQLPPREKEDGVCTRTHRGRESPTSYGFKGNVQDVLCPRTFALLRHNSTH